MMRVLTEPAGNLARAPALLAGWHVHGAERIATKQLASLLEQIESVTRDAETLVFSRSQADLNRSLVLGSWSVAECFDHLVQSARAFLPAISGAVAVAPNLTTNRRLRTGTLARLLILNLEPPYRLRYKVLAQIAPRRQGFAAAWNGFLRSQSELSETVRSASGLAIDRVKIECPVYARIRYNVYGAFRMLAAHERRHIWQVQQILEALDRRRNSETFA
jgi:DinB superfamily